MFILYGVAAFVAGGFIIVSSIFNAQIAKKIGIYSSALINNILATITVLAILLVFYRNFLS